MSERHAAALLEGVAQLEADGAPPFEMFDPEVELLNFDTFPLTRPYHGWDGVLDWLVDMSDPFDEFHYEIIDVLAADDDQVVTTCRVTGASRTGGPPFELVWGVVWTFRDDKVVRVQGLRTADEALEVAGLRT